MSLLEDKGYEAVLEDEGIAYASAPIKFLLNEKGMEHTQKWLKKNGYDPTRLVWMAPEEFHKAIRHNGTYGIREQSTGPIREALTQGIPLPPLIFVTNKQKKLPEVVEGRNRAHVSIELGIERVPVLVNPNEYDINEERYK
jgi:hypothetical protein